MSDRFKRIAIQYDAHTFLIGRVARKPDKKLEYERFNVVTYIGGVEFDVTKAPAVIQALPHFVQAFELEVEMKYLDQLHDISDAIINDFDGPPGAA